MSKIISFLKECFSFSSSERLGIIVLLVIVLFVLILPQFFDKSETAGEDMEQLKKEMDVFLAEMENSKRKQLDTLFVFDPNTADSTSLVLLGFSPAQARIILNYRIKGGRFYNRENFGQSFAVSEQMFQRLYGHIDIKPDNNRRKYIVTKKHPDISIPKKHTKIRTSENELSGSKPRITEYAEIEINAADTAELQKLRGIGSYYAKKIAEYREKLGGFYSSEQLLEIKGIDSVRFAVLQKQIMIDVSLIKHININTVEENKLNKHPYITNYLARNIIKYRTLMGKIASLDELLKEKILTEKQLKTFAPYCKFE